MNIIKISDMIVNLAVTGGKIKRKRRPNYASDPTRHGSGLWMKDAFDLVIAKRGCKYGKSHTVTNDKKIEGHNSAKEVKICNGCLFLDWDDGYMCTGEI